MQIDFPCTCGHSIKTHFWNGVAFTSCHLNKNGKVINTGHALSYIDDCVKYTQIGRAHV